MPDAGASRKLATIVALDVAGYSARTEVDEEKSTAEVAGLRGIIEAIAQGHAGRIFNTAGDGFMLEFGSSVAAVEAACELAERCEPKVRVGVHVGDVVVQPNGDLLGHGVNVAARLMAQSAPGTVLVSVDVRRMIRGPILDRFVSRGPLKLDKMAETIEAFALVAAASAILAPVPLTNAEPLLAVLPFDNLSNDPEMQFFSDGVSEEILQTIARARGLKVVGRNSSFQFRGADKTARKVASELRATHVLDGSVRRSGNHIRVTAHLVDAINQTTLWTDRYDRDLTDALKLQDEIASAIADALGAVLTPNTARSPVDPIAYDLYLRALRQAFALEEIVSNIGLLEEATRRAPGFADAWGRLAAERVRALLLRPLPERSALQREAVAAVERALAINPKSGAAHLALYWLEPHLGRWFERQKLLERAMADSIPGNPAWNIQTTFLAQVGRFTDALECARQGHVRDRADPRAGNTHGWILVRAGKYREARPILEEVLARWPDAYHAAGNLIVACAFEEDWKTLDLLIAPERLAKFPLRELTPVLGYVALLRDPSPESRKRLIATVRNRFEKTGHADIQQWVHMAKLGPIDEAYEIAANADFGPVGDAKDPLGTAFDRSAALFFHTYSTIRRDPRFVRLCARLGLVEFWMKTGLWPDCVEEVAPYYDFKAECEKVAVEPKARANALTP